MDDTKISTHSLSVFYGERQALFSVNVDVASCRTTAVIGPAGCGKSTLLRSFNRLNELVPHCRTVGRVLIDGEDVALVEDVNQLRLRVGMVFQKPVPFPMSVWDNVAFGPRTHGIRHKADLADIVERSLHQAALWDEVKDCLKKGALSLSSGQQQRLCIARALALSPEVLLLDEPTSSLDPASTSKIEDTLEEIKAHCTIVLVTHNMQQAVRVSDQTAFFMGGHLVECGDTGQVFTHPKMAQTEQYITGRLS